MFKLVLNETNSVMHMQGNAEILSEALTQGLIKACDSSMSRKARRNGRRPVYWWTVEIASLRSQCNKARRKFQRIRSEELRDSFKSLRKKLKVAIKTSKKLVSGNFVMKLISILGAAPIKW